MSNINQVLQELEQQIDFEELSIKLDSIAFNHAIYIIADEEMPKHCTDAESIYWLIELRNFFKKMHVAQINSINFKS